MKLLPSKNRNAVVMALAALALGGCAGTTYGTGTSPGAQTIEDIVGIIDFGSGRNRESIDYKPRPKIVPPPATAALPPPGEAGTVAAENWPRDPDVMARERQAAARAAAEGAETPTAAMLADPGFRLPAQEKERVEFDRGDGDKTKEAMLTQAERQRARQIFAAAKAGTAGVDENGVPIRTTLTEPPSEYRVPDPELPEEFNTKDDKKKKLDLWPF